MYFDLPMGYYIHWTDGKKPTLSQKQNLKTLVDYVPIKI